jgi:hypothetical protein
MDAVATPVDDEDNPSWSADKFAAPFPLKGILRYEQRQPTRRAEAEEESWPSRKSQC